MNLGTIDGRVGLEERNVELCRAQDVGWRRCATCGRLVGDMIDILGRIVGEYLSCMLETLFGDSPCSVLEFRIWTVFYGRLAVVHFFDVQIYENFFAVVVATVAACVGAVLKIEKLVHKIVLKMVHKLVHKNLTVPASEIQYACIDFDCTPILGIKCTEYSDSTPRRCVVTVSALSVTRCPALSSVLLLCYSTKSINESINQSITHLRRNHTRLLTNHRRTECGSEYGITPTRRGRRRRIGLIVDHRRRRRR